MVSKQEQIRELKLHIAQLEALPPHLRCEPAIASMKRVLAHWQKPDLILVWNKEA
jgi:hypothetical protein